jgi:hypothetical protein
MNTNRFPHISACYSRTNSPVRRFGYTPVCFPKTLRGKAAVNLRDSGEPLIPTGEQSGLQTHNRSDGKRFIVRANEMLTAFLEP